MAEQRFHVLGVSGSLRAHSRSLRAVKLVLDSVKLRGGETHLLDLRELNLPLYSPDREDGSAAEQSLGKDMEWADAIILASPDYHGSMSGAMKNFLDYNWEECAGKLFGYICSSHEKGLTVMDQMRTVVRQCYGWSMPYGVSFNGDADFDHNGLVTNKRIEDRFKMMARDLVTYGPLIRRQFLMDRASSETHTFAAAYRS
ncbi:MAG TPA: NADPH-dependent FMN reductase [Candidatus Acidoferrum sp.]|nr:NADPH-dependent FMN reductase [Candidatus Acidoferrum sp.]